MDSITPFDWHRLFLGAAPPLFYLEILFRTVVIWVWTMALLRWIGGRSIAQLSVVEFLLVIALGSAVGDAMFYPEVPLLHAMVVIAILVMLDKGIDTVIRKFRGTKTLIDGKPVAMMRDGVILCDGLSSMRMEPLELMELLRLKGVENLGCVRLAYLEPSGRLSVFAAVPPKAGLSIVPPREDRARKAQAPATSGATCCGHCGWIGGGSGPCPNCRNQDWVAAERVATPASQSGMDS